MAVLPTLPQGTEMSAPQLWLEVAVSWFLTLEKGTSLSHVLVLQKS